ncbi:reverse transcriptase domain-containing protein [Tanacetum coccineum]
MPFGLCNAPATFQRCMMTIFNDIVEDFMEVFIDDFSVLSNSFNWCLDNLDRMLSRCEETNLVLNWEKCHFMVPLLQGFNIEIKDKKWAKNLAADHLSRLENPDLRTFTEKEIADEFPDEHLMVLKTELNNDVPWGHHSASVTRRKVYESGFFWPTIFKDAKDYVMRCDACQRLRNRIIEEHPNVTILPLPDFGGVTTFTCPYGTFVYRRMPFGLCNAPATFQRCMMTIFNDIVEDFMEVFIDDFSVLSNSFNWCLDNLDRMLSRCEETNLVLNWEKCHFMVKEGIVLGHKILGAGIEVDRAKIDVIDGKFKPIYYASKTLKNAQEHYTTTKKELPVVVFSFDKFHLYLVLSKTIVYTDHSALKFLFSKQDAKPRLIRLENPDLGTFTEEYIADEFLDEHLMVLKNELNNDEPWGHHSASVTRRKVYESGFFWPTIFKDAKDYVMRCDACQRLGNVSSRSLRDVGRQEDEEVEDFDGTKLEVNDEEQESESVRGKDDIFIITVATLPNEPYVGRCLLNTKIVTPPKSDMQRNGNLGVLRQSTTIKI